MVDLSTLSVIIIINSDVCYVSRFSLIMKIIFYLFQT